MTFARSPLDSPMRMRPRSSIAAFTLVELLTVVAIILILVGISIGTYSYANTKAARSRAESEIRALAAACENYKLDNGDYPRVLPRTAGPSATDQLDASRAFSFPAAASTSANIILYQLLSGLSASGQPLQDDGGRALKSYFSFRQNQLKRSGNTVLYIADPWGNPYGYSTARYYKTVVEPADTSGALPGFNPTIDLWSTAGKLQADYNTPASANALWIKNW